MSINLTDFEGELMGFILHKGSSTNSDHYISKVKVGEFGLSVMVLNSSKLSLTISVTLILFICYFIKDAHNRNIQGAFG